MKDFVNDTSNIRHKLVISFIKRFLYINNSIGNGSNVCFKKLEALIEFILDLLLTQWLNMDVLFHVDVIKTLLAVILVHHVWINVDVCFSLTWFLCLESSVLPDILLILLALLVEIHVFDLHHELILICIEHLFVVLVVVIPCFRISWFSLGQDEDQVILSELCVLVRIGNYILDLTPVRCIFLFVLSLEGSTFLLEFLLILFISFQPHLLLSIESHRNDISSCR